MLVAVWAVVVLGRLGDPCAGGVMGGGCCVSLLNVRRAERGAGMSKRGGGQQDVLVGWLNARPCSGRAGEDRGRGDLRFAFYGRTSTVEHQDPVSSRGWQREAADAAIGGRGRVVREFFDAGSSRRRAWSRRPQAAALLAELSDPRRGFDAVVVGEYERAFAGDQLTRLLPVFERHGVGVWLPETAGPVDLADPAHRALLLMLGRQSQREVLRARHRALAAMRAQAVEQGRYLGGRPPYGYRLVDAGVHPNRAHARWGRRLRRLQPDPATAPYVVRMFAERLAVRAWPGSPGVSMTTGFRVRPWWTRSAMRVGVSARGRCGRWPASWPTRGTREGRCGTGTARITSIRLRFGVRILLRSGRSPLEPLIRGW